MERTEKVQSFGEIKRQCQEKTKLTNLLTYVLCCQVLGADLYDYAVDAFDAECWLNLVTSMNQYEIGLNRNHLLFC